MAGHQRDTDTDSGHYVQVPKAILRFIERDKPSCGAGMADADGPETHDAYLSLSWLLLEVLASGHSPRDVGRIAGGLLGKQARSHGSNGAEDALVQLEEFLESRGFMPKQTGSGPEFGFVLGRCPYEQAALANPAVVCGLHRALAEGMLESLGGTLEVTNLVARHPTRAGCRLEVRAVGQPDRPGDCQSSGTAARPTHAGSHRGRRA